MLFSLGLGQRQATQWLAKTNTLSPKLFGGRLAPGLSINEPNFFALLGSRLPQYKRIYVFSSHGWNRASFQKAQNLLGGLVAVEDNSTQDITHKQSAEQIR
jgi:hypothetical protein